jgi:hypothetical protein
MNESSIHLARAAYVRHRCVLVAVMGYYSIMDKKELKRLMKKLGQALCEAELDAMVDKVDTNGDGLICFEVFFPVGC